MGRKLAIRLCLGTPLALALAWVIRHLWGETTWWSYLVWAVPEGAWGLALLIPIGFGLALGRDRRVRMACRIGTISTLLIVLAICEPKLRLAARPEPEDLKVMQLNMEHGLKGVEKVANLIERERPDILFLQEAGPLGEPPNRFSPALRRALAGYEVYRSRFEAIAVRGQLFERQSIDLPETDKERREPPGKVLTTALAKVRGTEVRLVTLHFSPSRLDEAVREGISSLPAYLTNMARVRRGQYSALIAFLAEHATERVIVAGDFNAHPAGPDYRRLARVATDAFAESGVGMGFTLTASVPCERFDYLWSRKLKAVRCEVLPDQVSDHRAVMAWFQR